jgi:cellulose synthase/poly-beta-1,6-N-acetylglucosamine synthase-like glycosyltransferase
MGSAIVGERREITSPLSGSDFIRFFKAGMSSFYAEADVRSSSTHAGEDLCADGADVALYLRRLFLPLWRVGGICSIAVADNSAENLCWLRAAYGDVRFFPVPRLQLIAEIGRRYSAGLTDGALWSLARARPVLSAQRVVTTSQAFAFASSALLLGIATCLAPATTVGMLVVGMSLLFVATVLFRTTLVLIGGLPSEGIGRKRPEAEKDLPSYTLLVPLYREANVLTGLVRSLSELDYPQNLLQIVLIVEDDDLETAGTAMALHGTGPFEVVRVPVSLPRTKPKAVNYALPFARGEYVVIFDAEDRPERDQLRKAVSAFRSLPRTTACLQARLVIHSAKGWTSESFALDYRLWFGGLLPGLSRLNAPTPLGGTSNHFRTAVLRAIHAWDPFNVTEDADIGIRLAALGYDVAMLDSTTFEEAPIYISTWIKQRSRWLKGYMQTWLVHGREVRTLIRQVGWRGFVSFQIFIGGTIVSALVNPILWAIFAVSCFVPLPIFGDGSGHIITDVSAVGAVGSNALLTYLATFGARRPDDTKLTPYALTVTVYWFLISVAAYRALWQLITKPFHWEKTAHGLNGEGAGHV